MKKIFSITILVIIMLTNYSTTAKASTLYFNDFKNTYSEFYTFFGSCTPTMNGLNCGAGAQGIYANQINNLVCIQGDFSVTNTTSHQDTHQLMLWEDTNSSNLGKGAIFYIPVHGNFRLGNYPLSDIDSGIPAPTSGTNTYSLCKNGDTYTTYINGKKIQTEIFLDRQPNQVGFQLQNNATLTNFEVTDQLPAEVPESFLDLPWNYGGKSFEEVALHPESWFDHAYPLQNILCCTFKVRKYSGGTDANDAYRSHSGYDYARNNGIKFNTPVIAAAAGEATFTPENKSGGAGNVIKINHGNGYQSWYEHLDNKGLIISTEGNSVQVAKGQQIGLVGMTGNTNGPHIHFSVVKDENQNGTFNDDNPIGLVDPLGWEGTYPDPWTQYQSNGRNGAHSYNLFIKKQAPKQKAITTTNGGTIEDNKVKISIKPHTLPLDFTINMKYGPFESEDTIESVTSSLFLTAFNSLGDQIREFLQPVDIEYSYAEADLLNIKEDTLKLYYHNEDTNTWDVLPSQLNKQAKTVKAQTMHFSQFALMGELKDKITPTTEIVMTGQSKDKNWYRTPVTMALKGKDNTGGVGVSETVYKANDEEWKSYTTPLVFTEEGKYQITYQTIDNAYNLEDQKTVAFTIDKTEPEAKIAYTIPEFDIKVTGNDDSGETKVDIKDLPSFKTRYIVSDKAGNTVTINTIELKVGKQVTQTIESLRYNEKPTVTLDGNIFFTLAITDKNNTVKNLNQYFSVKGEDKVFTNFSASRNSTSVSTKNSKNGYDKKDLPGLILLKLETEKGKITYSY